MRKYHLSIYKAKIKTKQSKSSFPPYVPRLSPSQELDILYIFYGLLILIHVLNDIVTQHDCLIKDKSERKDD